MGIIGKSVYNVFIFINTFTLFIYSTLYKVVQGHLVSLEQQVVTLTGRYLRFQAGAWTSSDHYHLVRPIFIKIFHKQDIGSLNIGRF